MEAPFREQGFGKVSRSEKLRASCQGSLLFGCIIPHFTNHLSRSPISFAQLILPFTPLIGSSNGVSPSYFHGQPARKANNGLRSFKQKKPLPLIRALHAHWRSAESLRPCVLPLVWEHRHSGLINTSTDRNVALSVWAATYIYHNTQDTLNG